MRVTVNGDAYPCIVCGEFVTAGDEMDAHMMTHSGLDVVRAQRMDREQAEKDQALGANLRKLVARHLGLILCESRDDTIQCFDEFLAGDDIDDVMDSAVRVRDE